MRIDTRVLKILAVTAALMLSGCPGDELPKRTAFCSSFGPGAAFSWSTCTNCTRTNETQAYDRDLFTAAGIVPNAGQTGDAVTLLAQSTADIASGATVGAWVTDTAGFQSSVKAIRTLNGGVEQEVATSQNVVVRQADEGTDATGFIGMTTTRAFDAVEFSVTNTWGSGQAPVYYIYEICSDGGVS